MGMGLGLGLYCVKENEGLVPGALPTSRGGGVGSLGEQAALFASTEGQAACSHQCCVCVCVGLCVWTVVVIDSLHPKKCHRLLVSEYWC